MGFGLREKGNWGEEVGGSINIGGQCPKKKEEKGGEPALRRETSYTLSKKKKNGK